MFHGPVLSCRSTRLPCACCRELGTARAAVMRRLRLNVAVNPKQFFSPSLASCGMPSGQPASLDEAGAAVAEVAVSSDTQAITTANKTHNSML